MKSFLTTLISIVFINNVFGGNPFDDVKNALEDVGSNLLDSTCELQNVLGGILGLTDETVTTFQALQEDTIIIDMSDHQICMYILFFDFELWMYIYDNIS